MKQILIILGLFASITTFAQSPRIKLNQITKDTVKGSVLISSPSDSGMVYSRDFYIAYGLTDTVLILYGDTISGGGGLSSVLSDGVTITGNGTSGNELKVDTATVISTIKGLVDTLSARGYLTANQTITLSGDVTGSGTTAITATVVDDSHNHIISNVDFLQDSLNAKANDSDLANYVTIAGTETITGAKTFSNTFTQSGGDANFDSGTLFVDESANKVGIGTSLPSEKLELYSNENALTQFKILNPNTGTNARTGISFYNGTGSGDYFAFYINGENFNTVSGWNDRFTVASGSGVSNGLLFWAHSGGIQLSANGTNTPDLYVQDATGNVGIGTSSPSQPLDIVTGANEGIVFGGTSNSTAKEGGLLMRHYLTAEEDVLGFYAATTSSANNIFFGGGASGLNAATGIYFYTASNYNTLSGSERMRIKSDGEVIVGATDRGAYNLQCNGTGVWGQGAYVNGSDIKLKTNIESIGNSLNKILKLNPVKYNYKSEYTSDTSPQLGFIAQEVVSALDSDADAVVKDNGDILSMAYQNLIPLLTKAIQEQQAIIETQEQKITDLETTIQKLITRIEILENK